MNLIKIGQAVHVVLGAIAVGGASLAAGGISPKTTAISGGVSAACAAMSLYLGRYLPSVSPEINKSAVELDKLATAATEKK